MLWRKRQAGFTERISSYAIIAIGLMTSPRVLCKLDLHPVANSALDIRSRQYFTSSCVRMLVPICSYGMRGVLDIRVEATAATGDGGYHSGVHGGSVEEPMQVCNSFRAETTCKLSVLLSL